MDGKTYCDALERHGKESYKEYTQFRVNVPPGKAGPWSIGPFETQFDLAYLRLARDGRPPGLGKFTALRHERRGVVMSDTIAEIKDLRPYLWELKGNVLISGLGLGMVAHILTKCPKYSADVVSLTIVEKDPDVLRLSEEHYRKSDKRIAIHHADITSWTPPKGAVYDAAWHDIWDSICEDNRAEMTAIKRRFQRCVAKGKQFCWGQDTMDQQRRSSW